MFAPILDNTGTHLRFDETESFPPWIEYLLDSLLTILSQGIATFIKDVASCRAPIKLRELDTANAAAISVLQDYAKVIADNSVCVARQQKNTRLSWKRAFVLRAILVDMTVGSSNSKNHNTDSSNSFGNNSGRNRNRN